MAAPRLAIAGVMIGWFIVAVAMVLGRRPSHGARVRQRSIAGLLGLALQGIGFGLAFGWRRASLGSSAADWGIAAVSVLIAIGSALFVLAAVRVLGKRWSLLPRLVEEHVLIEEGPCEFMSRMAGFVDAKGAPQGGSSFVPEGDVVVRFDNGDVMRCDVPGTLKQTQDALSTTYQVTVRIELRKDPFTIEHLIPTICGSVVGSQLKRTVCP